jgi:hypothetical protein
MEQIVERRSLYERRQRDVGPPAGCADRRRLTERRVPRLPENTMSDAEWQSLFGVKGRRDDASIEPAR